MSKSVIIVNNGTTETWSTVDTIRVNAVGGGTEDFVPEDETTTGTITITANGEYNAADDGLYGYSTAIVNVPGMVTGYIDGELYTVTVDENGDLVETPVEV